jgi:hypothetical protein
MKINKFSEAMSFRDFVLLHNISGEIEYNTLLLLNYNTMLNPKQ